MSARRNSPNGRGAAVGRGVARRVASPILTAAEVTRIGWFAAIYLAIRWLLVATIDTAPALAMREATAWLAAMIMRAAGLSVQLSGQSILAGDSVTSVSGPCLPISALAVGVALILSSRRISTAGKVGWSAVVVGVTLALNVPRVALVAVLAMHHSVLLEPLHLHLLPVAQVLVSVALWALSERVGPHA